MGSDVIVRLLCHFLSVCRAWPIVRPELGILLGVAANSAPEIDKVIYADLFEIWSMRFFF